MAGALLLYPKLLMHAFIRLFHRYMDGYPQICSALLHLLLPARVPEHAERIEALERIETSRVFVGGTVQIVSLLLFRIRQNLIGLVYFLESFRRIRLFRYVRMVFLRKGTESVFYILLRRVSVYTQYRIIVFIHYRKPSMLFWDTLLSYRMYCRTIPLGKRHVPYYAIRDLIP